MLLWLVACMGIGVDVESVPSGTAVVTTRERSTLVASGPSGVATVLENVEAGTHALSGLPPNATVSTLRVSGEWLRIHTIAGVEDGHRLWEASPDHDVGTIEIGPTPATDREVEWLLLPAAKARRLGDSRQVPLSQWNLDDKGALDVFFRVTENGRPVSTGFSTDVDPTTGRAEISGWTESPTLVELQYRNTTTDPEQVSLAIAREARDGWDKDFPRKSPGR